MAVAVSAPTIEKNHCRMLTEEEKAALRQDLKDTLEILRKLRTKNEHERTRI